MPLATSLVWLQRLIPYRQCIETSRGVSRMYFYWLPAVNSSYKQTEHLRWGYDRPCQLDHELMLLFSIEVLLSRPVPRRIRRMLVPATFYLNSTTFKFSIRKKEKHLGNFTTWIKKYLQGFFESHFSHFWFFFIFCTLAVSLRTPWTGYDLHSWYEQPPHGVFTRYCSPTTRQCWDSDQCQQH